MYMHKYRSNLYNLLIQFSFNCYLPVKVNVNMPDKVSEDHALDLYSKYDMLCSPLSFTFRLLQKKIEAYTHTKKEKNIF